VVGFIGILIKNASILKIL